MLRMFAPFVFLAACASGGSGPSAPTPTVNEEFTLAPGQTATVTEAKISLTFERVTEDSRCPVDVTCIWEGDAVVLVKVKTETDEVTRELHTQGGEPRSRKAPAGQYVITLVKLEPAPRSTAPVEPAAYRATLVVGRE
jgi:hypothetical protein